jgi:uncharacterized protein
MTKLKILAVGDLHGDSRQALKLAKQAEEEKVDFVILTGDIHGFQSDNKNLISPFVKRNQKVLFVPGNHESFATADFMAEFYGISNLHGYSINWNNIGIFGCGGANIGIEALTEDEIYQTLRNASKKIKDLKKKIMVTHIHPSSTKIEKLSNFVPASDGVEKAIRRLKPDLLLCSHVHEAEGLEEKIGNTKILSIGRKGKIIQI